MSNHQTFVVKANKPLGAAFSHARKVAAKTGGGKKKEREVANRYLKRNGEKAIGKSNTHENHMNKSTNIAAALLGEHLSKAAQTPGRKGEGSRGGKIIGHTKTGKPIYAKAGAGHASYAHFTNDDHRDAVDHHEALRNDLETQADEALGQGDKRSAKALNKRAEEHENIAGDHSRTARIGVAAKPGANNAATGSAAKKKTPKTDMYSLGMTSSGKPVYAEQSAKHYDGFTNQDHEDAGNLHREHQFRHDDMLHAARRAGNSASAMVANAAVDHHSAMADDHFNIAEKDDDSDQAKPVKNPKDGSEFYDVDSGIAKHKPRANHIIATTKSNKSIMADGSGTRGFSVADHEDAASAHSREAQKHIDVGMRHGDAGNGAKSDFHQAAADHHLDERDGHLAAARSKRKSEAAAAPSKDRAYHATAAALHDRIGDHHAQLSEMAMDHGDDDGEFHHRTEAEQHRAIAANHRAKMATKSESTNDFSAADVLGAYLAKGGEGTRGGKIVGHTKSGKPIYGHAADSDRNDIKHDVLNNHKEFSAADHREAASKYLRFEENTRDLGAKKQFTIAAKEHHDAAKTVARKSDGDGDGAHAFAKMNNADPDRILVRPVMDVENSPLNDAIAAAWPGMPFVAQAASNFCAMDNQGKLGI